MAEIKKKVITKKTVSKVTKPVITDKKTITKETKKETLHTGMVKTLTGTVVSTKMQGTIVVSIERKVAHKLYGKLIKVTKKIKADTNGMEVKEGDVVKIQLTRPISRDKNYKVIAREEVK